ncbi:MAG: RNA polymerase sigma factor [Myxococcota bacterium]
MRDWLADGNTPEEFAADRALMRRVAENDSRARRDLVQRLLPRAQRLCQSLLRNASDAKDASQTALLQVLRSVHSYRGECSIEHWSDRIVSRTALRWIATERRSPQAGLDDDAITETNGAHPKILFRECLNRLPEAQRTALLLRCCFEYSIDEIASLTEVSPNTVKDRLTRARQTLRAWVRGTATGDESDESEAATLPSARAFVPPRRS